MVRIRLRFDSTPVHYARQCWFLFDPSDCRVVGDVAFLIGKHFGLSETEGIQLYMDDFLVPANESVEIIRDNDTIQVKAVAASSHHNGATAANNSWSVDQSEESPAKKSKPSTSPKPVKMKLPKKRKNKKLKVKNRTEDTSKKQSEGNDSVTTFFQNLLNAPLRTSQLPGKDRVMSTPTTASKNTTRKPAGQNQGCSKQ